jgi:hypothetical protein
MQETAKPVQMMLLVGKINEILAGEKTTTQLLSDPRVVALMPQLSRSKVRVELALDYRLGVMISPENYTIVFEAI